MKTSSCFVILKWHEKEGEIRFMDSQLYVIGIVLFILLIIIGSNLYTKIKLRKKITQQWGKPPSYSRFDRFDQEDSLKKVYEKAKKQIKKDSEVDDITWEDLDMFSVFEKLNHTYSSIGSENLYKSLRIFRFVPKEQNRLEQLIDYFSQNPEIREKVEFTFAQLGKKDNNFVVDYLTEGRAKRLAHLPIYIFLGALPFISLGLFFAGWDQAFILFISTVLFNIIYYQNKKIQLDVELTSMSYLIQTIVTAKKLSKIETPLKENVRSSIRPLKGVLKFSFSFRIKNNSNAEAILDYLNMMIMLPFISYHFVLNRLDKYHNEAFSMWEALGQLEVACAILNYRTYADYYCLPEFRDGMVKGENISHPLLDDAVTNPVEWQRNTLVTGSNASGKSTYVKAVAVNCILAQTIFTCTADSFSLERGHVLTSMAIKDDICEGDSYFVAEIKSVKRILEKVKTKEHCYCFIDEILRGTNTIERIAASHSILKWLSDYPSLAFVATHDIELTEMLKDRCDNVHFEEQITNESGISFDYILRSGPARSRNALKLLDVMNYPDSIINEAEERAKYFEKTKQWTAAT